MEKFDLEKAKQGRQIVHEDGDKAMDWHYFEGDTYPIFVQWSAPGSVSRYKLDSPDIGLAPERVEGHLTVYQGNLMTTKYGADYDVVVENPLEDLDVLFKVSCNPDGSDPTIEKVEE